MVDSLCAMISVVRPCMSRCKASCTKRSDSLSKAEVASSRISMRGLMSKARAIEARDAAAKLNNNPMSKALDKYN